MTADLLAAGRAALIGVVALSVGEKVRVLRTKSAGWHPLIVNSPFRRQHAKELMQLALAADIAVAGLLAFSPYVGGLAFACLVGCYTMVGSRRAEGSHCSCFWGFMNSKSRPAFLARNTIFISIALGVAVSRPRLRLSSALSGLALMLALALIVGAIDRYLAGAPSRPVASSTGTHDAARERGRVSAE